MMIRSKAMMLQLAILAASFGLSHAQSTRVTCDNANDPSLRRFRLNRPSGKNKFTWDLGLCPKDLSSDRYTAVTVENNSGVDVAVSLTIQGPWKPLNYEARNIVKAGTVETVKLQNHRPGITSASDWYADFTDNIRGLPGGHVMHWKATMWEDGPPAPNLSDVRQITLEVHWEDNDSSLGEVTFTDVFTTGEYTFPSIDYAATPRPLFDQFGQSNVDEWDRKIGSMSELQQQGVDDLQTFQGRGFAAKFSIYGGWAEGPNLGATGHFRTHKDQDGKWWFVDPDGYLFWSAGVTDVGNGASTDIDHRPHLFYDFSTDPLHDVYKSANAITGADSSHPETADFYTMNVIRKYGDNWAKKHEDVYLGRMKYLGINTMGSWSKLRLWRHPYTLIADSPTRTIAGLVADPFSQRFKDELSAWMSANGWRGFDPFLIGVFTDNEIDWELEDRIPDEVLKLQNTVPARKAMEDQLQGFYGTIAALNAAWGSSFASFAAINGTNKSSFTPQFRADMNKYLDYFADEFFKISNDMVRQYFPDNLNLGARLFGRTFENPIVQRASSRYCDVIGVNIYRFAVDDFSLAMDVDKPWIIGEFSMGTGTDGVWGVGLLPASDEFNQGECYDIYMNSALNHPNFIGAHWFKWSDQHAASRAALGRSNDGENSRIGFVNVADRLYEDFAEQVRATTSTMYEKRYTQIPVTGVIVNPDPVSLPVGGNVILTASVLPLDATDKRVRWVSSDTNVVQVSDGFVTGLVQGSAQITVISEEDASIVDTCQVYVGTNAPDPVTPSVPTGLSYTNLGATNVDITWNLSNSADEYDVQFRKTGDSFWDQNGGVLSPPTSLLDLADDTEYEVQVRAINVDPRGNKVSAWSSSINFTTLPKIPLTPTGLSISNVASSLADITWDASMYADQYDIQYKLVSASVWTQVLGVSSPPSTITGLTDEADYEVQVRATNSIGASGWSSTVNFTTLPLPDSPVDVTAVYFGDGQILITWGEAKDCDQYRVQMRYRDTDGSPWNADNFYTISDQALDGSYIHTLTGQEINTPGIEREYMFRVRGFKTTGGLTAWSPWPYASAFVSGGVDAPTVPKVPSNLSFANLDRTSVDLSWSAVEHADLYDLRYKKVSDASWTDVTALSSVDYTLTGLEGETEYEVQVQAVNVDQSGDLFSGWTLSLVFTTLMNGLPPFPIDVTATDLGNNQIRIDWGEAADCDRYRIQMRYRDADWSTWNADNFYTITDVGVNGSFVHTLNGAEIKGPSVERKYEFRVRGFKNTGGFTDWSKWPYATVTIL